MRSSQEAVRPELGRSPVGARWDRGVLGRAVGAGRELTVLFSRLSGSSSPFSVYRTHVRHRVGVGIRELVRG